LRYSVCTVPKEGIIRYIDVHNINQRPPLEALVRELEKVEPPPAGAEGSKK